MEKTIIVKNLTKKFGDFIAVNSISFEVYKGEIFGFLGANGAGKTTTIRMLCGILSPDSGDAFVSNFSIRKEPEKIKEKIGYMSQKFSLYMNLTVKENIEFYSLIYNMDRKIYKKSFDEVIYKTELEEFLNRKVSDLPQGIRQRVSLATAIIHSPEIIFLDEPTAGVSPILRRRFWNIIEDLAKTKTILVTTHYMDEVENCDRLILMNEGKIIASGKVSEIKKEAFKDYMYAIEIEKTFEMYEKLKKFFPEISIHGSTLHIYDDYTKIKKILNDLNIKVFSIEKMEPGMDDAFIKLIKRKSNDG